MTPLVAPDIPGRHFIEILCAVGQGPLSDGDHRVKRLLLAPLYVEVPEPDTPDAAITAPRPDPIDPAQLSARLLALYNAERARLHSPPLVPNAIAAALARERIEATGGRFPRERPRDMQVRDDLRQRGLHLDDVFTFEWTFESLDEGVWMDLVFLNRRLWLLDPAVDQVGLAVKKFDGSNRAVVYLIRSAR